MFFYKSEKKQLVASSRTKEDSFKKKCLKHDITLLEQSSDKRNAKLFRYLCYKKSIEKFQIQSTLFRTLYWK